jgi:hypothetical protein
LGDTVVGNYRIVRICYPKQDFIFRIIQAAKTGEILVGFAIQTAQWLKDT